uniref:Uncharacterized protein n=1 Tax=Onchocerca volvulus TaxID=6282 RepID=A0A8R1TQW2_ONCVO
MKNHGRRRAKGCYNLVTKAVQSTEQRYNPSSSNRSFDEEEALLSGIQ